MADGLVCARLKLTAVDGERGSFLCTLLYQHIAATTATVFTQARLCASTSNARFPSLRRKDSATRR